MVFTADTRIGAMKVSMNTAWADDYIHDCLRYERGDDADEVALYQLYARIEFLMERELEIIIYEERKWDTYDFFEDIVGNDVEAYRLMEKLLVKVVDEESDDEESEGKKEIVEAFKRVATEMTGGMAKVSVNL